MNRFGCFIISKFGFSRISTILPAAWPIQFHRNYCEKNINERLMMQIGCQIGEKHGELKNELEGLRKEIYKLKNGMAEMKEEIVGKNVEFEKKIAGLKNDFEEKTSKMEEKTQKALSNLTDRIDRTDLVVKFDSNSYKFDASCGSKMIISDEGFVATLPKKIDYNCIRTNFPIPTLNMRAKKPAIAFYYEVKILRTYEYDRIEIGFCDNQFPLDGSKSFRHHEENSFGFESKRGMPKQDFDYDYNGDCGIFGTGDVVGIGIINPTEKSPMKCFATLNGRLYSSFYDGKFLDEGLVAKLSREWKGNCVRANLPIPTTFNRKAQKSSIAFYYEVEILEKFRFGEIEIGFCDKQFPLELKDKWTFFGKDNNSFGFGSRDGMEGSNDDEIAFENEDEIFTKGDIIGIGIINPATFKPFYFPNPLANSPIKYFATLNGELHFAYYDGKRLGIAELPEKFGNLQLFPAIIMSGNDVSIRANFGQEEWKFKQFKHVLEQNDKENEEKKKKTTS